MSKARVVIFLETNIPTAGLLHDIAKRVEGMVGVDKVLMSSISLATEEEEVMLSTPPHQRKGG